MSKQYGAGTVVLALAAVGALGLLWLRWSGADPDPSTSGDTAAQRSGPAPGLPVAQPRAGERLAARRNLGEDSQPASGGPAVPKSRAAVAARAAEGNGPSRSHGMAAGGPADGTKREVRRQPEETYETVRAKALSDPDPDERIHALEALDTFEGQPVVPILTQALSDPEPEVRLAALEELTFVTDEPPLDALSIALSDTDPEVRSTALRMVADSEDQAKWPLIQNALQDPDEDVRSEAEDIVDLDGPAEAKR